MDKKYGFLKVSLKQTLTALYLEKGKNFAKKIKKRGTHAKFKSYQESRGFAQVWHTGLDETDKYSLRLGNCLSVLIIAQVYHNSCISQLFHVSPGCMLNKDSKKFFELLVQFTVKELNFKNIKTQDIVVIIVGGRSHGNRGHMKFKKSVKRVLDKQNLNYRVLGQKKNNTQKLTHIFINTRKAKILVNHTETERN